MKMFRQSDICVMDLAKISVSFYPHSIFHQICTLNKYSCFRSAVGSAFHS